MQILRTWMLIQPKSPIELYLIGDLGPTTSVSRMLSPYLKLCVDCLSTPAPVITF